MTSGASASWLGNLASTLMSNTGIGQAAQGQTGNPVTQNPTNSSLYGIPEYQLMNPDNGTSSSWQLANPSALLYAGPAAGPAPELSENAVVAALADKLKIKAKKGQSLEEQVLTTLGKRYKTKDTWQAIAKATGADKSMSALIASKQARPLNYLQVVASHMGVSGMAPGPDSTASASDVAKQFLNMNRDQISALQQKLFDGGWYDGAIYSDPNVNFTPGQLDTYTTMAIGNLLNASASAYKNGTKATWQQVLDATSSSNASQVDALSAAKKATAAPHISEATQAQVKPSLQSAFEKELGYLPSEADITKFTSQYDAAQAAASPTALANQGTTLDFGVGGVPGSSVPVLPGTPSVSAAALSGAQAANPTGYLGHQVENAYALFLNALGMGRTATATLPGYNPNVTQANTGV